MTLPTNRRHLLRMAAMAPLIGAAPALAQTAPGTSPSTPGSTPGGTPATCPAESADAARLRTDFPWLARYAEDNAHLLASGIPTQIVFMGDSITQGWFDRHAAFFPAGRVNRGIGGQTTPQMVLRMTADVIALRPRAVHIMAGTNDIAGNTGPMTAQMTHDNIEAMATLAHAHGIRVILASIPPAANFPWRPGLDTVTPITAHNAWLRDFASRAGHVFIDYHPVLDDGRGGMREGLAIDGVHPAPAGYAAMESVLLPLLTRLHLT